VDSFLSYCLGKDLFPAMNFFHPLITFTSIRLIYLTGEETKGALKSFMATSGTAVEGEGLWAKLRRDAMPEKSSEARPWTSAGGARPQSSASAHARAPINSSPQTGAMAPRRIANPRAAGPAARKPSSGGSSGEGGSAPGGQYLGGSGSVGRRGRAAAMDEELMNDDNFDGDEEIPPEILAILEEDKFVRDVRLTPHSSPSPWNFLCFDFC
jgi:hypothetical protein